MDSFFFFPTSKNKTNSLLVQLYCDDHARLSISFLIPVRRRPRVAPFPPLFVRSNVVMMVMVVVAFLLARFPVERGRIRDDQFGTVSVAFAGRSERFVHGFFTFERLVVARRHLQAGLTAGGFVQIFPGLSVITI